MHAALQAVRGAGRVGDDDGGAVVFLGLLERLDQLVVVGAHRHLGDIDVVVAHKDCAQIFLAGLLAARRELRDGARGRGLRALAAGVGVNLGVDHQDIHVSTARNHVVEPTEADVVCPTVAAEHPKRLLSQLIFELEDLLAYLLGAVGERACRSFDCRHKRIGGRARGIEVIESGEIGLACSLDLFHGGGLGCVAFAVLRVLHPAREHLQKLLDAGLLGRALLGGTQIET